MSVYGSSRFGSKWLIGGLLIAITLSAAGLGVAASASSSSQQLVSLNVTGSSTLYPLWTEAQSKILEQYNIKLNIQSTGSGNGVKSAFEGTTDFGNASRNPKASEVTEAGARWQNLRTIKLGTDALVMYVKVPESCSDTDLVTSPRSIVGAYLGLTAANLTAIESATGDVVMNPEGTTLTRGNEEITLTTSVAFNQLITDSTCSTPIQLFTRNTTASGTRDGFLKIADRYDGVGSWIDDEMFGEMIEKRVTAGVLDTTNEANAAGKQAAEASSGGATFLSYGFVPNVPSTVTDSYAVPKVKFISTGDAVAASINTISNGSYNWSRNLNTIFNVTNPNFSKIAQIVDFFVNRNGRDSIRAAGFIPLTLSDTSTFSPIGFTDIEINNSGTNVPWIT